MSKLILNVSKEEFENRLASAIEGAMQSPLKKKRTQILNAAMVQILHGGRADGQHEHNLEQFWKEDSQIEVECQTAPKAMPEPVQEPEKRFVTIHTIIKTVKVEGQDEGIDNISVYNTLSADEHDRQLLEFFRQYAEENESFENDDLIAHSVTQGVMSDAGIDDEELEDKDFDQIVEWLCENGRPNMLVDMIPDLTYGMCEITVEYKQEQI